MRHMTILRVLRAVRRNPGTSHAGTLAQELGLSVATVRRVLDRLIDEGTIAEERANHSVEGVPLSECKPGTLGAPSYYVIADCSREVVLALGRRRDAGDTVRIADVAIARAI